MFVNSWVYHALLETDTGGATAVVLFEEGVAGRGLADTP
jgi:hypothetical protein